MSTKVFIVSHDPAKRHEIKNVLHRIPEIGCIEEAISLGQALTIVSRLETGVLILDVETMKNSAADSVGPEATLLSAAWLLLPIWDGCDSLESAVYLRASDLPGEFIRAMKAYGEALKE